ncbi:MAG: hypothetical protein QXT77_00080 [Candidatus Methanomethylicaceae archaeon]
MKASARFPVAGELIAMWREYDEDDDLGNAFDLFRYRVPHRAAGSGPECFSDAGGGEDSYFGGCLEEHRTNLHASGGR